MSDRKMSKITISYDDGTTKITHEHDGYGHWNVSAEEWKNVRGIRIIGIKDGYTLGGDK